MNKLFLQLKKDVDAIKSASTEEEKLEAKNRAVVTLSKIFEPEAKLAVQSIEKRVETTQDHYGDYMNFLSGFRGLYRVGMVKALKEAGASNGLEQAYNIM